MESLSDIVNMVTIKDYETEIKTVLVDQCHETKDNALFLARARAAWRSARATLLRNEHKRQQGEAVEEIECALEPSTQETLLQQFQATYHLQLGVRFMPADTLLGRLYQECQRVIAASRIKSLFWASKPQADKTIVLAQQVQLKVDREEHVPVRSVLDSFKALWQTAMQSWVSTKSPPRKSRVRTRSLRPFQTTRGTRTPYCVWHARCLRTS